MVYIPIFGSLTSATGIIIEKTILKRRKLRPELYQIFAFLGLIIACLPFIFFFWEVESEALKLTNLIILSLIIIFSVIHNILGYRAIKGEDISNIVSARALSPLFIIITAIVFSFFYTDLFKTESNIIVPGLIAAAAILLSHVEKHHLKFNKFYFFALLSGVFGALELNLSRIILEHYSSVSLYFVRVLFVFILSLLIFRPKYKPIDNKTKYLILFVSLIWVIYRLIIYSGYQTIGVIETTTILMLSPTLLYLFSYVFLKEKIRPKQIISSAVVILCIAYIYLV